MATNLTAEFESLFLKHHQQLVSLSYNIVRDKDLAEDVVQEVFEKLWNNRDSVLIGEKIGNYLFKATAHTSLTQLTRQRKRYRLDDVEELKQLVAPGGSETLAYKEFELKSRQAIDRLPPRCKTIFLLSLQEGMKYQEIAETLSISLKAVENQMGIALKKLRTDLKPFLTIEVISILIILASLLYSFFSKIF